MHIFHRIDDLRRHLAQRPAAAFVATMGNLHEGHLNLIDEARRRAAITGAPVVASIFVNRLQFGPNEDFDRYPRTLDADAKLLQARGCEVLFAPDEQELYPQPQGFKVIPPAQLGEILEGEVRPGFFTGVCTVVHKLFNIVNPHWAIFGKKDYQQWMVLRNMVSQMALDIEVIGVETARNETGLALSSRNAYLSPAQREQAQQLSGVLQQLRERVLAARAQREAGLPQQRVRWQEQAMQALRDQSWQPDYVELRRRSDLQCPTPEQCLGDEPLVALAAARLGSTRLIDNLEL